MSVTARFQTVTHGTVLVMRRTGTGPRLAPRARVARALAVVLASLALLLGGAADVLPRSATGPGAATAAAAAAPAATRAGSLEAPSSSLVVRAAGLTAVPAPTGPGGGLPPTAGPLVAPHLVADPQSRPPTSPPAASTTGALGSRAPPGHAGT
jgi:hypothetical protein